jgi:hypothetical protein
MILNGGEESEGEMKQAYYRNHAAKDSRPGESSHLRDVARSDCCSWGRRHRASVQTWIAHHLWRQGRRKSMWPLYTRISVQTARILWAFIPGAK